MDELVKKSEVLEIVHKHKLDLELLTKEIQDLPPSNRWTKVDEALPTDLHECEFEETDSGSYIWHESEPMIVKHADGVITIATYIPDDPTLGEIWLDEYTWGVLEDVVAWSPVPLVTE